MHLIPLTISKQFENNSIFMSHSNACRRLSRPAVKKK